MMCKYYLIKEDANIYINVWHMIVGLIAQMDWIMVKSHTGKTTSVRDMLGSFA